MENNRFVVESSQPFSESLIWQLNRSYYEAAGIAAWSNGVVPHNMTSNSMVGKTYARLILGVLQDLAAKGATQEKVYILELGAGHGRLAFHILKHLERLIELLDLKLPPYCYVLSDIVEDNLSFFQNHPQLQPYFDQKILETAYFDAINGQSIALRQSAITIDPQDLNQPIIAIANYFFDSIPNDLFLIQNENISTCSIALESTKDPEGLNAETLLKNLDLVYDKKLLEFPFYPDKIFNDLLEDYRTQVANSHLFFPQKSLQCLANLQKLSKNGMVLLSMDKGFFEIDDLQKKGEPEIITHGSFSLWVNYHALGAFCEKLGGKVFYPMRSNFYLQIGCLLFLPEGESYTATNAAYQQYVNDFGPDDFHGIKGLAYQNITHLKLKELLALLRLSAYDSSFFMKVLPRLKQVSKQITVHERRRYAEAMHEVWNMYFHINEPMDLTYEIGGVFYDLGFYKEALLYFQYAVDSTGQKADIYYNQALCHYQLRQDDLFIKVLAEGKQKFPGFVGFNHLDTLSMDAV